MRAPQDIRSQGKSLHQKKCFGGYQWQSRNDPPIRMLRQRKHKNCGHVTGLQFWCQTECRAHHQRRSSRNRDELLPANGERNRESAHWCAEVGFPQDLPCLVVESAESSIVIASEN